MPLEANFPVAFAATSAAVLVGVSRRLVARGLPQRGHELPRFMRIVVWPWAIPLLVAFVIWQHPIFTALAVCVALVEVVQLTGVLEWRQLNKISDQLDTVDEVMRREDDQ